MNTKTKALIAKIIQVNEGDPWFGRSAWSILDEVNINNVRTKPAGVGHSMLELLYHMITWADFTLQRIVKNPVNDLSAAEQLDWREIDPQIHTWEKGLAEFKSIQKKIITALGEKQDAFLEEIVDYRSYNFDFLVNGMIEHTIYHLGQIAYVQKML